MFKSLASAINHPLRKAGINEGPGEVSFHSYIKPPACVGLIKKKACLSTRGAERPAINLHITKHITTLLTTQKTNNMIVQSLLGEFMHEAQNTRKLLQAIPDSALDYKPSPVSWTTGQLASHIAEVYNWFHPTFHQDVFDMASYKYDKGDISKAANIVTKFEENLVLAQKALETATDDSMFADWKMVWGSTEPIMPVMPRIQVVRGFLFNHLYHHRGEMIIYLRSTGNKVPGLYGPTAEESNG